MVAVEEVTEAVLTPDMLKTFWIGVGEGDGDGLTDGLGLDVGEAVGLGIGVAEGEAVGPELVEGVGVGVGSGLAVAGISAVVNTSSGDTASLPDSSWTTTR